jgi:hypothetical protein
MSPLPYPAGKPKGVFVTKNIVIFKIISPLPYSAGKPKGVGLLVII